MNTFGRNFAVTTFGESHGPAVGAVIDGCPAQLELSAADIQPLLDRAAGHIPPHISAKRGRCGGDPLGCVRRDDDRRARRAAGENRDMHSEGLRGITEIVPARPRGFHVPGKVWVSGITGAAAGARAGRRSAGSLPGPWR